MRADAAAAGLGWSPLGGLCVRAGPGRRRGTARLREGGRRVSLGVVVSCGEPVHSRIAQRKVCLMRLASRCVVPLCCSLLLGACVAPPPELAALPAFEPVEVVNAGTIGEDAVSFRVRSSSVGPANDEWAQSRAVRIAAGSSVVISVPLGAETDVQAPGQGGLRTSGYFNQLEQQVEFALMELGFDLRDRAKFDAKLVEQDGGEAARVRTIGQLMNAANGIADFVLQINRFEPLEGNARWVEPMQQPEVQRFVLQHPGLAGSGALERFEIPTIEGVFNAKLISVETGSVVWTGSHSVDSLDVLPRGMLVTIRVDPRATNEAELAGAAEQYSIRARRVWERAQGIRERLLDPGSGLKVSEQQMLVEEYERTLGEYERMMAEAPEIGADQIEYAYEWSRELTPDLPAFFEGSGPSVDALEVHRIELLRTAARELIGVIRVDG